MAALFGTADASEVIQAFESADELRKQHVLKQCLDQTDQYSLADEQTAGRFIELLQKLSDDGQYAIVQTIGQIEHQRDILEPMYAQIQATQDDETAVARLYRYLAVIATRNDK